MPVGTAALDSRMRRAVCLFACLLLAACELRPAPPRAGGPGRPAGGQPTAAAGRPVVEPALAGGALLDALRARYTPARTLGYGPARDVLFAWEQAQDGALECLYTGWTVSVSGDPSTSAFEQGVNTEHVWPQSLGARAEPLRSDMHHLFPTRDGVNSSRSSLPFGEVDDARADAWYRLDASQSRRPDVDLDAWSERGQGRFEPRERVKGDVARAVFYVATIYGDRVDMGFFDRQRETLLAWNAADPPDAAERARSAFVASRQGTENPFVLDATLAERAFGAGVPARKAPDASAPPAALAEAPLWISEIHYDNAGDDTAEGVEVQGAPGTRVDAWRLVLYNGNGGRSYGDVRLAGVVPASGALWVPIAGLQNGSPDGVALVDPGGRVAAFLSYEGVFDAADGPAAGQRSADIGVEQSSGSPAGRSLGREAPGGAWRPGPASPGQR